MKHFKNYEEFSKEADEKEWRKYIHRFQELAGIEPTEDIEEDESYYIQVTFDLKGSLFEHETYTFFQKTNNRYSYHPLSTNPPVEAHYHIKPSNGNNDLYAVNMDGKAHHKINRGYEVPRKEAEELRKLGVKIPENNIIESLHLKGIEEANLLTESLFEECLCVFIKIE